jgi:hypothetical protein
MLLPSGKINMVSVFLGIFQILGKVNYFAPDIVAADDGSERREDRRRPPDLGPAVPTRLLRGSYADPTLCQCLCRSARDCAVVRGGVMGEGGGEDKRPAGIILHTGSY